MPSPSCAMAPRPRSGSNHFTTPIGTGRPQLLTLRMGAPSICPRMIGDNRRGSWRVRQTPRARDRVHHPSERAGQPSDCAGSCGEAMTEGGGKAGYWHVGHSS